MNEFYWDSFGCQIQCEEFYNDEFYGYGTEFYHRKPSPEEDVDWMDANVEGVTVDGEPLDGHYFDRMIEKIPF